MARDIGRRLNDLKARRSGTDRMGRLNESARGEVLRKRQAGEPWQKREASKPYTNYVLGAMAEVDPDYTRISIETAERVGNQLNKDLTAAGFTVEFDLQGSVPLNVHIRGVSDVDLLNLDARFVTYSRGGIRNTLGMYRPLTDTSVNVLQKLRRESEGILERRFYAATVDKSGGKAISISGGSLPRPVDVVPSHWHDTDTYQRTQLKRDRGVIILNKRVPTTISNMPFLHIAKINEHDTAAKGGLKKAVRLCKNVKNDSDRQINLPSFDLAAVMYHANMQTLATNIIYELVVLGETQRWLDHLYHNEAYAKTLMVPDGSRRIFDTQSKYEGLKQLSYEFDELAKEVAKEQNVLLHLRQGFTDADSRNVLAKAIIF